jgi:inosose dehydratase
MSLRLANAPTSWGIEPPDPRQDPPWQHVLDEIARSGYPGTELGPIGYLPGDGTVLTSALAERGLALAAGFVMEPLHVRAEHARIEAVARHTCRLLAAAGARTLIVMDAVADERAGTAGRTDAAPRLEAAGWDALEEGVRRVAAVARDEGGVSVSVHPHVGTHIEFEDEVEHLLSRIDGSELGLCVDTGHSVYAGIDPAALLRRHAGRVRYVHLKDLDAERLARVRSDGLGFYEAVAAGLFRPLGEGCVDFPAVRDALEAMGYDGWATVEQDRVSDGSATPFEEACASLSYLREVGLATDEGGGL